MSVKKKILAINGSASPNSSNLQLLHRIADIGKAHFDMQIIDDLTAFPAFRTELTDKNTPRKITDLRMQIEKANGVIICTPEYVFSIPSGLKNILEWCVSTTVFSDKPVGLITASASGEKGHAELQLIMKTIQAHFKEGTVLLIQGIKGKMGKQGEIVDESTKIDVRQFVKNFVELLSEKS